MVSFGICLVAGADRLGDRWLWPQGDRSWRRPSANDAATSKSLSRWIGPIASSALLVLASLSSARLERPESLPWRLHEISTEIGRWSYLRTLEADYRHLGTVDFHDKLYREYERSNGRITLFIATDDRRRRDKSILSPKTQVLGNGWETIESEPIQLADSGRIAQRLRQRRGAEEALSIHFRIGADDVLSESLRWLVAYDLRPDRRPEEVAVVRITSLVTHNNLAGAQSRLIDFMTDLEPKLARAQPTGSP
jgi:EpsI family protein